MSRYWRLAALVLCAVLLFTACGKDEVSFVYYTDAQIKTLDPQLASSQAERTAVKHLFSGLYRLDENGTAVPDAAVETVVSADGLTYTFTLDEEDVFYDGKNDPVAVTADDYVFGLQRALLPSTNAPDAGQFLCIKGARQVQQGADVSTLEVRALDDTTLQICLETADEGFLEKLAGSAAMPCNRAFFESCQGSYGLSRDEILGNGPFYLSGWSESAGLTLRLQEGESALASRLRIVPDDQKKTAAQRLSAKEQDLAVTQTAEEAKTLQLQGFYSQSFETGTTVLVFNCSQPAFSNQLVRQALGCQAAASVQSALEQMDGEWTVAEGLVPGAVTTAGENYRQAVGNVTFSLSLQQRYAAYQLGLSQLETDRLSGITVLVPDQEPFTQIYQTINQDWQRELGAFFSVETLPLEELIERVQTGDFDLALMPYLAQVNDPARILQDFVTGASGNVAQYENSQYDQLVENASEETTAGAQHTALREAEQLLLSQAPVVPLWNISQQIFLGEGFEALAVDPFGPVFDLTVTAE